MWQRIDKDIHLTDGSNLYDVREHHEKSGKKVIVSLEERAIRTMEDSQEIVKGLNVFVK